MGKSKQEPIRRIKMKRNWVILLLLLIFTSVSAQDTTHAVQLKEVTDEEFTCPIDHSTMIVRLAEIEVYPQYLAEYLSFANEVDRLSVEREPGVVCLFPMQSTDDSTQIRIREIYASEEAYQQHLKTEHFQRYKQGTLHMVKNLKLPTMQPLDPETMKHIFKKQR